MSIWKCFQMAMSSIVGNKMRSILTMLGIIIGITAVIALVSLMSGMTSEITDTFEEMGIESINEYYLGMKKYNVTYGRELTYVDVERKQKVCVIGTYIAKEIFGGDALGKSIQITGTPYEVVGILEEQDDSTENSSDNCVYIPYTLASYTNRTSTVSSYVVYAVDQEKVEEAVLLLEALCDKDIGDSDYYTVRYQKIAWCKAERYTFSIRY